MGNQVSLAGKSPMELLYKTEIIADYPILLIPTCESRKDARILEVVQSRGGWYKTSIGRFALINPETGLHVWDIPALEKMTEVKALHEFWGNYGMFSVILTSPPDDYEDFVSWLG